jgi:hypothetical protein
VTHGIPREFAGGGSAERTLTRPLEGSGVNGRTRRAKLDGLSRREFNGCM